MCVNDAAALSKREKERDTMRRTLLAAVVTLVALALGTAGTALADNNATGSTGAVQVGNTAVNPTAGASQAGATAGVAAPTSVAGTGNNTASNSIGSVQAGGGNTSSNAVGVAQSSPVS